MLLRCLTVATLCVAPASAASPVLLSNSRLVLRFDPANAALLQVRTADGVRLAGGTTAPVDVLADRAWQFARKGGIAAPNVLCLDGQWDFRTEKGKWLELRVPGYWEAQGITQRIPGAPEPDWKPYNGTAYYRTRFHAPAAWRGKRIVLVIFGVDDEDWTSINGRPIGHTGKDVENWWQATRRYAVPEALIKFDASNELHIKVFDRGGDGGIAGSVFIGPADEMARAVDNQLRVQRHRVEQVRGLKRLTFDCVAPGWEVQIICELPARGAWFRRRARWTYVGKRRPLVERVRFYLPSVCIDRAQDCVYSLPSLWPPRDIAFEHLTDGRVLTANMWGTVPPVVVVHNKRRRIGLTVAAFTTQESFEVLARERAGRIDIENRLRVIADVKPGQVIELGDEYVAVTRGGMLDAIRTCKQIYRLAGFRTAERAPWTYGASIYSLPPGGSQTSGSRDLGTFHNFRKYLLPRLQRLGIDIVWFLPTNPGGYAPTQHFAVNPRYGTLDDLRAVCEDAHRRAMRIFLDLIPHGPKERSPAGREILPKHADWVMHDHDGAMKYRWGCLACDYAHPGWQDYIARVATFYVKRCDIDGWRVDVAGGWAPNWRPYGKLRPSQSSPYGALRLLRKVRTSMQGLKPDIAMLGEIGSWVFLGPCDFVYDWPFEQTCRALVGMRPEKWAPAVTQWLERQQAALPDEAKFGLMRFLENHDQWKALWHWGPGHHRALLSLCALVPGLPLVFSDQDIGFGKHIQWLNDMRERLPELARGRAIYTATQSSAPAVAAFTRALDKGFTVVVINFSREPQRTTLRLPLEQLDLRPDARYAQRGLLAAGKSRRTLPPRALREWGEFSLRLSPYDTRLITFRPVGAAFPFPTQPTSAQTETRVTRPTVSTAVDGVVVDNGHYRLKLKDGLIRELRVRGEKMPLITSMNIVEGRRKVWPGPRLDFGKTERAKPRVRSIADGVVVSFEGRIRRTPSLTLAWRTRYRCTAFMPIEVEVELVPPQSHIAVCGELRLELQFAHATDWAVNTFAGQLRDEFAATHPLGDMMRGWKYWHRSGLLWEAAQLPTGLSDRTVCARVGNTWLDVGLPRFLDGLENAYLRERDSRGKSGLTLCLAWLDQKRGIRFDRPLRARFVLHCAGLPGEPSALNGPGWTFAAEGANYIFKNEHYTLVLGKSRGGGIFGLTPARRDEPVVTASNVYSDRGLYGTATTPDGRTVKEAGLSSVDYETDARFWRDADALVVEFQSFLRSRFRPRNVANPRVQYRLRYRLDSSRRVQVECAVRPLISSKGIDAFLAQTLSLPNARAWHVKLARGEARGRFAIQAGARGKRVWESIKEPLGPKSELQIELATAQRLRLANIAAPVKDVQNVFVLDAGGSRAVVFFAFFACRPVDYLPSWRRTTYTLEALSP